MQQRVTDGQSASNAASPQPAAVAPRQHACRQTGPETIGTELELSDKQIDAVAVLVVNGRIEMTTSDAFCERLLALLAAGHSLVIDFSGVDYISSAGLRALMVGAKQARAAGSRLAVAALQPVVLEIFQISRFDKLLPCHPSVDAAVAAVKTGTGA